MLRRGHVTFRCFHTTVTRKSDLPSNLLQKSQLPTDFFQRSLPRLSVPKLNDSLVKYLSSMEPLLSSIELERTADLVETFENDQGAQLQKLLEQYNREHKDSSFVSEFWFDMYLRDRRPLVLNHNPFMAFNPCAHAALSKVDVRAANMIYSSMRFYRSYIQNILKPEVFHLVPHKTDNDRFLRLMRMAPRSIAWYVSAFFFKAYPLDMSQYPNLFASTRLPHSEKDILQRYPDSKHIIVLRKGHFYKVNVLTEDGDIVKPEVILSNIRAILDDSVEAVEHPVAVMTGVNRDTWTTFREQLLQHSNTNAQTLDAIDSSLFALCLDSEEAPSESAQCKSFLHSNGVDRWFDKSFSLIFSPNGEACVNFEHSWGDGVAVLRYFNEIFSDSNTRPVIQHDTHVPSSSVHRFSFDLSDDMCTTIKNSWKDFRQRTNDLTLDFTQVEGIGKFLVKRAGVSPDAFVQLAIQLAYYKISDGKTAPTYESCSTAAFRKGRTETIRSCTSETKWFCETFSSTDSNQNKTLLRYALQRGLNQCSTKHGSLTKEAAMGNGWDRHLFALRKLAEQNGIIVPFFQDKCYQYANSIVLSTSTLSSPAVKIGGFAPVIPNGFGIGYGIDDDRTGCVVTAYKSHGASSAQFVDAFQESCKEIASLF